MVFVKNFSQKCPTLKDAIDGGNFMAHKITDSCISCGACASECPVEAIKEGAPHYTIDAETCIDCGACVSACPSEAIVAD